MQETMGILDRVAYYGQSILNYETVRQSMTDSKRSILSGFLL